MFQKNKIDPENVKNAVMSCSYLALNIFLTSGLAAQKSQTQKFCTTKSTLMKDWAKCSFLG